MTDQQKFAAALVVDAARATVTRIAPDELEVFDEVAADWRKRAGSVPRKWTRPGGSVGFGIDATLLSELVLQAVAAGVGEVLVLGAVGAGAGLQTRLRTGWQRWRGRDRSGAEPDRSAEPESATDPDRPAEFARAADSPRSVGSTPAEGETGPAGLLVAGPTEAQLRALREACQRHALTLGLTAEAAELLADATVGALVRSGQR